MFVIGTAGHIDHGKSAIITRLTGVDPDRLPEEKRRGMTIDLGFGWYDTPHGKRIGIIDVPGHERFVRNMIAGAGGIDAVILVVAADDGWMPQSQEHLQIIRLLGIKYGLIAISKIDLVERSWVDMVEDDLRSKLKGTFLEDAPVIRLSSATGEGFDQLKNEIDRLAERIVKREDIGKPRLYIDRSFVLPGMGGVATGTLRDGQLRVGQQVAIFPARRVGKIRTLQSHNEQVEISYPGQRTAVSLTGLDKIYLQRGGVISLPEIVNGYPADAVLALSVSLLAESQIAIEDKRKLLMVLGTSETEGETRLFEDNPIAPGEEGIIFFRPYDPLLAFIGDRFILRLPTPPVTIGGGAVLAILNQMPHRKNFEHYRYLRQRVNLKIESLIESELIGSLFIDKERDFIYTQYSAEAIDTGINNMMKEGTLGIHNGRYYRPEPIRIAIDNMLLMMHSFFEERPHIDGLAIGEIARLVHRSDSSIEAVVQMALDEGRLIRKKNRYDLPGRLITISGELKEVATALEKEWLLGGFMPLSIGILIGEDRKRKEAFDYLVNAGTIVKIGAGLAFHKNKWEEIITVIRSMLDAGATLTVAVLRERLNSSRKFAVPILEETDRLKITERQGDIRVKGEAYNEM
jgi:selenocysteine-specific elongation factor